MSDVIHERVALRIDIRDAQTNLVGYLLPLTISTLEDTALIQQMTRWRNQARRYFLTQFIATPERTRRWLETVVFQDYSCLLFLIHSQTKRIGHYGFKNLMPDSVEVDNLVRGEIGGHPKLIHFAEYTLIKWLFDSFSLERVYGFVLSDNRLVLDLHRSVGFEMAELVPLHRAEFNGETHLQMGSPGRVSVDGLYSRRVELHRQNFCFPE